MKNKIKGTLDPDQLKGFSSSQQSSQQDNFGSIGSRFNGKLGNIPEDLDSSYKNEAESRNSDQPKYFYQQEFENFDRLNFDAQDSDRAYSKDSESHEQPVLQPNPRKDNCLGIINHDLTAKTPADLVEENFYLDVEQNFKKKSVQNLTKQDQETCSQNLHQMSPNESNYGSSENNNCYMLKEHSFGVLNSNNNLSKSYKNSDKKQLGYISGNISSDRYNAERANI
jgi:hypothetical protein